MIHLVTDSTTDILPDRAAELGIHVVPLTVRFGEEQFRDGIDLTPSSFYPKLQASSENPTTSQPSPQQFTEVYKTLLADPADSVVSLHIASHLSGTLQSATLAAQDFEGRVHLIDSESVSGGVQLALLPALAEIAAGATVDAVVAGIEDRCRRVGIYVLLDTLTYLARGGRVGRAQAFVGGMLNVKPIITVTHGEVGPKLRVRGFAKGIDALAQLVVDEGKLEALATFHCNAPQLEEQLVARLNASHPDLAVLRGELGAVVGTYAGPDALGVAYLRAG